MNPLPKNIPIYQSVGIEDLCSDYIQNMNIELRILVKGLSILKNMDFMKLRQILAARSINVLSIHLPVMYLSKEAKEMNRLITLIQKLSEAVFCKEFVIHPSKGTVQKIQSNLENIIQPAVMENGWMFSWENLTTPGYLNNDDELREYIATCPNNYRCFDITHSDMDFDVMLEYIKNHSDIIREFHLSNRCLARSENHLPLFSTEGDFDATLLIQTIKAHFDYVRLVLEYDSPFSEKEKDILEIQNIA